MESPATTPSESSPTTAPSRAAMDPALPSASFLGRQPILDSLGRVVAHDLLFRDSRWSTEARIGDPLRATAQVLVAAFAELGIESLLSDRPGFVNADPELAIALHVDALPECDLVFDIPAGIEVSETTIGRIERLREAGFDICLDDYGYQDPRASLLRYARYVKVDFAGNEAIRIRKIHRDLEGEAVTLIATRVETAKHERIADRQGWPMRQGYFFARPETVSRAKPSIRRGRLLEIVGQIDQDTPVDEVANRLRSVPHLTMNILSMANLVRTEPGARIESIQQALVMVGRERLLRWLHLLLFASDDPEGCAHPLCQLATTRGIAMEALAKRMAPTLDADRAALAGMLSLTPALLGLKTKEVVQRLSLDYAIENALMSRKGPLGRLLLLVETREANDVAGLGPLLEELGLDWADLAASELEAIRFANDLFALPTEAARPANPRSH